MSETKQLGLVIYGDGSARPNPGFIGSGFHAYYYDTNDKSEKTDKNGEYFTTDNGYQKKKPASGDKHNGEIKGTAVKPIEYVEGAVSYSEQGTNNYAELNAILEGLRNCWNANVKRISIVCDSEYTLSTIRKDMNSWSKNGWMTSSGKPVSNIDTVKDLFALVNAIKAAGVEINVSWVRGHMEIAGNTNADILSNIGRSMSIAGEYSPKVVTLSSKKFTDYEVEKHPLLTHKRIYFVTKPEQNIPGFYFQGDSGASDFMIGKRLPETGYSVVILNEPDKTVEDMKQRQFECAQGLTQISCLLLDRIFDKKIFRNIDNFGMHCTEKDKRNTNVNFLDNKPLTMVMNPTGLSLRAISSFNNLSDILRTYMVNKDTIETIPDGEHRYLVKDITSEFYETEEKQVKKETVTKLILKKEYVNGIKNVILDHDVKHGDKNKTIKVPLIFGTDLPDRNQIKRLESRNPKVKLITWRYSDDTLNYAVIIESDDSIGIWSNFYSDQIFLANL